MNIFNFNKSDKFENWDNLSEGLKKSARKAGVTDQNVLACEHVDYYWLIPFNPEPGVFMCAKIDDGDMSVDYELIEVYPLSKDRILHKG